MNQTEQTYPFPLLPLPYEYDALCPHISAETLYFHHDKHLATYVKNLNSTLKDYPNLQNMTLPQLICNVRSLPDCIRTKVKNNAGGVYNHNLYFESMTSAKEADTSLNQMFKTASYTSMPMLPPFYQNLLTCFGTYNKLEKKLKEAALDVFGSGYAWLVTDKYHNISIMTSANQNAPICQGYAPLLNLDVWEHAYYLDYQNRRAEYIDNWFTLVNWPVVEQRYNKV